MAGADIVDGSDMRDTMLWAGPDRYVDDPMGL